MKLILSLCLIFLLGITNAQNSQLQSSGDIPSDFTTSSAEKYKKEIAQISRKTNRSTKKNQKDFFLESNFGIDELLLSGHVMFNDPISKYVKEVAAELLKDEPKLLQELRFYTTRSSAVNAFATNQGMIFINVGLIAKLKNEAQLAFIISHEIAHYREKHSLEFYLESKKMDKEDKQEFIKRNNIDQKLAKNLFSKEQESEADELGLDLFFKSKYDLSAVEGAFMILKYADLPFDEVPFDKTFFEDQYLTFPTNFQALTLKEITLRPGDDDEESTHPSINKRRKIGKAAIDGKSNSGRKNFVVSEDKFKEIQNLARYECLDYHLRDYRFYDAIYNAYILSKSFPDDLYLKQVIAKALYGMTKFRNADKFSDYKIDKYDLEGEIGKLVFFLNKMNDSQLNALALRYAYLLKENFQDNSTFQDIVEDLGRDFIYHHDSHYSDFLEGKPADIIAQKNKEISSELDEVKIKNQKVEIIESTHIYYAFGDLLQQKEFVAMMDKFETKEEIAANTPKAKGQKIKRFRSYYYYTRNTGEFALGKEKILVVNPFYLRMKKDFEGPSLIRTEKSQKSFRKAIEKSAKNLKLKATILDSNNLTKGSVEEFNDMRTLSEWFSHQISMEKDLRMIAFNQEKINQLALKYDVDSFVWTGVISGKLSKFFLDDYPKLIFNQPSFLYHMIVPSGESIIFSVVLNAESGGAEMVTFEEVPFVDQKDIVRQRVYDIFAQIRKK